MFGLFSKPTSNIKELLAEGALVVDVRSPREFAGGNYKGSINIPLETIAANIEKLKQETRPIIVVCLSGGRSAAAVMALKAAGITAVNGGGWHSL